jgi:hypothetical protein
LEIWNVGLNSIEKKNRGTSSIQLNILNLQLTVHTLSTHTCPKGRTSRAQPDLVPKFHRTNEECSEAAGP